MKALEILFWISLFITFYAFLGYGILLYFLVLIKRLFSSKKIPDENYQPLVSLVIPCFNEAPILDAKVSNCRAIDYPADKLEIVFITDGSTDNSTEVLKKYPDIKVLHENRRGGKTAAENRAMKHITSEIVVFTDANTILNPEVIKYIVRHFSDPKTGCVSGEKRVLADEKDTATAGEGIYWKYESFLKKLDSELYSAVGAAGELVAFRTSLYRPMPEDTLLDDFIQSMEIAADGYRIVYEPLAYAMETGSASIKDEWIRKVRISAGGWQSVKRLAGRITPFRNFTLFFQYFSHRVLRWVVTPFLLILMFILNFFLVFSGSVFYQVLFLLQVLFYMAAFAGWYLENKKTRMKILFVPYYFCMMNLAAIYGFRRFISGPQKGAWEKAKRK
ncbi:MAG TPA: glycosyltransferase family 2 protein [Bacteroidales bacterium]|nr:glycosyltransferase family 2 protein [Bacteroidales bacterium]